MPGASVFVGSVVCGCCVRNSGVEVFARGCVCALGCCPCHPVINHDNINNVFLSFIITVNFSHWLAKCMPLGSSHVSGTRKVAI